MERVGLDYIFMYEVQLKSVMLQLHWRHNFKR
jgi:hypothetical protein